MESEKTKHHHFILHKPIGAVSQFVYPHKRKKILLGDLYDFPDGTMAIGRLDVKSEGLLLLTTDGKVSERVRSNKVEKEYHIQVDGEITDEAIGRLKGGVEIGIEGIKYLTKPCEAFKLINVPNYSTEGIRKRSEGHRPTSWASITLTEGKNRQVRKMFAAVGFPVLRLVRNSIQNLELSGLVPGEHRIVTKFDILNRDIG